VPTVCTRCTNNVVLYCAVLCCAVHVQAPQLVQAPTAAFPPATFQNSIEAPELSEPPRKELELSEPPRTDWLYEAMPDVPKDEVMRRITKVGTLHTS
jgi:hypothetical protein